MANQTVIVSVLAETKKFKKAMDQLSNETNLSKLGDKFKTAGSKIAGYFKTGLKTVAAVGSAITALALKGGWDRLVNIENAQAKLRGLGHSAEVVTGVMDDALKTVKGTAFGLDEAAGAAASALAAGIKPGQELQKYLGGIGDAATIAGVGLSEMGSIYGKIATSGIAYTAELNQISDRGIPIFSKLAEQYGVNAAELRKMVSEGKVSAQDFYTAMNDLVGGAALESGNTTVGAFKNMRAALSRVGASFLTEIFPMFKGFFNGITGFLDELPEKVKPIGLAFSAWIGDTAVPAAQNLFRWLKDNVVPVVQSLAGWVRDDLVPALKEFAEIVGGAVSDGVKKFAKAMRDSKADVPGLAKDLGELLTNSLRILANVLAGTISSLASFSAWVVKNRSWIVPLVATIGALTLAIQAGFKAWKIYSATMAVVSTVTKTLAGIQQGYAAATYGASAATYAQTNAAKIGVKVQQTWTKVTKAATVAQRLLTAAFVTSPIGLVVTAIAALVAGLVLFFTKTETGRELWSKIWGGIQAAAQAVADWFTTYLVPVFQAVWAGIQAAAQVVGEWFQNTLVPWLQEVWTKIQEVAQSVADWYNTNLAPVFQAFGEMMGALFERIGIIVTWLWQNVIQPYFQGMVALWSWVWEKMQPVFRFIGDAFKLLWEAVKIWWETIGKKLFDNIVLAFKFLWEVVKNVFNLVKEIIVGAFNFIKAIIESALNNIKNVFKVFAAVFKGDWKGAWEAVKTLFSGAWDGIKKVASTAISSIGKILGGLKTTVVNIFKSAGSWLFNAGKNIVQGLLNGAGKLLPKIGEFFLDKLPGWIQTPFKKAMGIKSPSRVFMQFGEYINQGLVNGVEKLGGVKRAVAKLSTTVEDRFNPTLSFAPAATPAMAMAAGSGAGIEINLTVQTLNPTIETARAVKKSLKDLERIEGTS